MSREKREVMMTRETVDKHVAICVRYEAIAATFFGESISSRMTRMMDLERVDDTVMMDWDALLAASNQDFVHDVAGIHRHMNRETGELGNCFLPRFAARAYPTTPA